MTDEHPGNRPSDARRRTVASFLGVALGTVTYLLSLMDWGSRLDRTANSLGYASNFFDIQGRAFLDGELAVPPGSLGIEGFIRSGAEYMYFPPWPALLRLPLLSTTTEFDGQLTVASMALAFALFALMTTRLLWLVRDLIRPDQEVDRFEAAAMAVLLALVTGGTTLTYVASLPWVYHEVYSWVVAFTVGALYWMLRVLRDPSPITIGWLLVFDLGAIMTRTTGGWAMSLGTIALGVWLLTGRAHPGRRRIGWLAVGAGALALAAGIVVNWLKFQHLYLFPLEDQVWSEENEHRRDALEANGGTITGLQFFRTALMAYFRLDGIRFVDYFPFLTLPAEPARAYADAVVDQSYRTGSVVSFMPLLLVLSLLALPVLFRRGVDRAHRWLRLPLIAGVLVTGGVMAYGYFAHRYTAEFVPALVLGSAVGGVAVVGWLQHRPPWVARSALGLGAVLTAYSMTASLLVGHTSAAFTAGGPRLASYLDRQLELTPDAQARLVTFSEDLPSGGSTDDLWIRGDCDALYVNSGDAYDTWLLVERRSRQVEIRLRPNSKPGRVQLFVAETTPRRTVWLQTNRRDQARVQLVNETGTYSGGWFDVLEPRVIRVGIRDLPQYGYAEVSSNPGGHVGLVRTFQWDENYVSRPVDLLDSPAAPGELAALGMSLRPQAGLTPDLCPRIRANAQAAGE